jgi:hypothetical protein
MKRGGTIFLVGHGPSARPTVDLIPGIDVGAVSGGIAVLGDRLPDHWFLLDRPEFYRDELLCDDRIQKHTHDGRDQFNRYPNACLWQFGGQPEPSFTFDRPLSAGPIFNSLLFAVQAAACMGYSRLWFIGCDLQGRQYAMHRRCMQEWYPLAAEAGIEWINGSPASALAEFLPTIVLQEGVV